MRQLVLHNLQQRSVVKLCAHVAPEVRAHLGVDVLIHALAVPRHGHTPRHLVPINQLLELIRALEVERFSVPVGHKCNLRVLPPFPLWATGLGHRYFHRGYLPFLPLDRFLEPDGGDGPASDDAGARDLVSRAHHQRHRIVVLLLSLAPVAHVVDDPVLQLGHQPVRRHGDQPSVHELAHVLVQRLRFDPVRGWVKVPKLVLRPRVLLSLGDALLLLLLPRLLLPLLVLLDLLWDTQPVYVVLVPFRVVRWVRVRLLHISLRVLIGLVLVQALRAWNVRVRERLIRHYEPG